MCVKIRHGYFANLLAVTGSVPRKDFAPPHPSPLQKCAKVKKCAKFNIEVWFGGWAIGAVGHILGRHISACATMLGCVRYYFRLRVLLCCVHHISACASIL